MVIGREKVVLTRTWRQAHCSRLVCVCSEQMKCQSAQQNYISCIISFVTRHERRRPRSLPFIALSLQRRKQYLASIRQRGSICLPWTGALAFHAKHTAASDWLGSRAIKKIEDINLPSMLERHVGICLKVIRWLWNKIKKNRNKNRNITFF